MGILLKKELVEKVIEKIIARFPFEESVKIHIRKGSKSEEILEFFLNGVNLKSAKKIASDMLSPKVESIQDFITNTMLMTKAEILKAVLESIVKMKGISANLSDEEKINLLIDLKNTADINEVESIIADTLEIDLNL